MNEAGVIRLRAASGAMAEVHRFGAHVTSWRTADGVERLFLSERAVFDGKTAIRGGIPVIFPQFAGEGPLPKHGFARTLPWTLVHEHAEEGPGVAMLELRDSRATQATWPHRFVAHLTVVLGDDETLQVELAVLNRGDEPFVFTSALHTYLRVPDAFTTRVTGLQGAYYRDSAAGGEVRLQDEELVVDGEINRIYRDVPGSLRVESSGTALDVAMTGFHDVVVWNPGEAAAAELPDMAREEASQMLCIEAASIGSLIRLTPGEHWQGRQMLRVPAEG